MKISKTTRRSFLKMVGAVIAAPAVLSRPARSKPQLIAKESLKQADECNKFCDKIFLKMVQMRKQGLQPDHVWVNCKGHDLIAYAGIRNRYYIQIRRVLGKNEILFFGIPVWNTRINKWPFDYQNQYMTKGEPWFNVRATNPIFDSGNGKWNINCIQINDG